MKKKKEISEKIKRLRDYLEKSKAKEPDDLVYVEGGIDKPADPADSRFAKDLDSQRDLQKVLKDGKIGLFELVSMCRKGEWEKFRSAMGEEKAAPFKKFSDQELQQAGFYTKQAVENQIENLRSELEQLGGDQQIQLLNMQRLMNARSQRIQASSSIENKDNQTKQAIIANMGR